MAKNTKMVAPVEHHRDGYQNDQEGAPVVATPPPEREADAIGTADPRRAPSSLHAPPGPHVADTCLTTFDLRRRLGLDSSP